MKGIYNYNFLVVLSDMRMMSGVYLLILARNSQKLLKHKGITLWMVCCRYYELSLLEISSYYNSSSTHT